MNKSSANGSLSPWWWLGLVALAPLLYLLSVPAVLWCTGVNVHPQDLRYHKKKPQWIKDYCAPYIRALNSNTQFKKPLEHYMTLWGYKRNPILLRSEVFLEKARESLRKSREEREKIRAQMDRLQELMEQRKKKLPGSVPTAPVPVIPESKRRDYESLLRKSS
ncbi:hypothetical protein DES53_10848 [Roseimicrobium gellanilyticum]|uniref:Transmembrane protein n=1 Tax=Roseimicrobium gellanilyticum TaxID=748857 RepID=A0A366HD04_9BACT|nr:hypothetical protein [Roseimicrobium gellanilyticum]RBP40342.1 hypothetical protein DES53_10848 [Roseimicrobium gellanilyticum]